MLGDACFSVHGFKLLDLHALIIWVVGIAFLFNLLHLMTRPYLIYETITIDGDILAIMHAALFWNHGFLLFDLYAFWVKM